MNMSNICKTLFFTQYVGLLFLLYGFGCIQASGVEVIAKAEAYKKYFQQQEELYQELLKLGIPGVRPLSMNEVLAEEVLSTCPQEVNEIISSIELNLFCEDEKNIILHGMSGTGKSCLAQAIAIKNQTPCLFFNVASISTQYMNSGVQNLSKIFEYAKRLEQRLDKPCVIIFDELESLTKKHVGTNNHENTILINFWQELDNLCNSRVVVVGTMNSTEDLPVQVTNRTSMIEIPLPKLKDREAILSYYLKRQQDKYKLTYPARVTATYLAEQTEGFCNRDLKAVVVRAMKPEILEPGLPDRSNKNCFETVIEQIKKDPKRKLEREIGTWKHTFRTHFRDPKIALPVLAVAVTLGIAYNTISNQRKSIAIQVAHQKENIAHQKESLAIQIAHQKENVAHQKESLAIQIAHQKENVALQKEAMEQAQRNADKQTSMEHMAKQAAINSSFMGIPVGPIFYWSFMSK